MSKDFLAVCTKGHTESLLRFVLGSVNCRFAKTMKGLGMPHFWIKSKDAPLTVIFSWEWCLRLFIVVPYAVKVVQARELYLLLCHGSRSQTGRIPPLSAMPFGACARDCPSRLIL